MPLLANITLVLSSKDWKHIQDEGQRQKIIPKSHGPVFSLCRSADAALVRAHFFAGAPTIEDKIVQKSQNTKASVKVAVDLSEKPWCFTTAVVFY